MTQGNGKFASHRQFELLAAFSKNGMAGYVLVVAWFRCAL